MRFDLNVTVRKDSLLEVMKKNRKAHAGIVAEARAGYVTQAREALEQRLKEITDGKVVALVFRLAPPEDHTADYDTVLQMLEMHTGDSMDLPAEEFRRFVEDKWDWSQQFYSMNKRYSTTANIVSDQLGY